jgi:small GTP-binding protein
MLTTANEVARRRTFAIISHPDAGKTTLTEKLLLYAGAIHIAGSVKARKASRYATSDWMEIEKQRGISVASSVMQMEYRDCVINLLDTPGHKDFSEDTYRVLTAVDAALMVIDAANGVESQTLRLLEVCRARNTPIITFINKMDREVRDPLELIDDIERTLGMPTVPFTWPVGMGKRFGGVFDIRHGRMRVFRVGADKVGRDEIIEGIFNLADPMRSKQLRLGLTQLGEKGAIQVFRPRMGGSLLLGAIGMLQFDVAAHRLKHEYNVDVRLVPSRYRLARWISAVDSREMSRFIEANLHRIGYDAVGAPALLASSASELAVVQEKWKAISFHALREHAGLVFQDQLTGT